MDSAEEHARRRQREGNRRVFPPAREERAAERGVKGHLSVADGICQTKNPNNNESFLCISP